MIRGGFGWPISGARLQPNNYRLEGISRNDYANGAPGSVLGGSRGDDAIQEFSVATSSKKGLSHILQLLCVFLGTNQNTCYDGVTWVS